MINKNLGGFNNGNAETNIYVPLLITNRVQDAGGSSFVLGEAFFDGSPILGTLQVRAKAGVSSYNAVRGQKDSEGNIEYYTDKHGKQTETERDYSEYYSGTTEGTKKKVRMKFQLKTRL